MSKDTIHASLTVSASPDAVFDVLADPATHASIDGTGWVRESLDGKSLTEAGQIFRIAMYHDNLPTKNYEVANKVVVFDRPRVIAWEPGQDAAGDGQLSFGGWIWRYELAAAGPNETNVTLIYDWSGVSAELRQRIQFPPFDPSHLENSLRNLSELAASR